MDVVYFELNNWFSGRDFPPIPFIVEHLHDFSHDIWCIPNKLCVVASTVDMSTNWCVTAPLDWVKQNCPELLTDEKYSYEVHIHGLNPESGEVEDYVQTEWRSYKQFLRTPEADEVPEGRFGCPFLEWSEENLGVHWWRDPVDCEDYEEDEDEI